MLYPERRALTLLVGVLLSATVAAQQRPPTLTADDYARAERFMSYNTSPLVLHGGVRPTWISDNRFWYRTTGDKGAEAWLVDATAATKTACDLAPCKMAGLSTTGSTNSTGTTSPDGKKTAFIRDWNLWVRDVGYRQGNRSSPKTASRISATPPTTPAGRRSDRPIVRWSPDSRKIATFQQDERNVGEMYLVDTGVGHPKLQAWKYPLAGDQTLPALHRVVVDATTGATVRFKMPPDLHRSSLCDDITCRGSEWADVQWDRNSSTMAFVSTSRDHRREQLRVANASTGEVKEILQESVSTFYESGNGSVNWRYLPASNEVIWFSETRQLGTAVSPRPGQRPRKEPDHQRRRQRHPAPAGRREESRVVFPGRGQGKRTGSVFSPPLPDRLRRKQPAAAHTRGCRPRRHVVARRRVLRRRVFDARHAAGRGASRRLRQAEALPRKGRSHQAFRDWLEATAADHGEGARRRHRPVWAPLQAHESRSGEEISNHQPRVSRPADRQCRRAHVFIGAGRRTGARRARLRRGGDRRDGHALALEIVPRGVLRQHGRQHARGSSDRHETAGRAVSVDRPRTRRHLRPLRRRLRGRGRHVSLSRFLQGRHFGGGQSRQSQLRGRLGGKVAGAVCTPTPMARPTTTTRRISSWRRT